MNTIYDLKSAREFFDAALKRDKCIEWTRGKTAHGYGELWIDKKTQSAHRIAWMIENGPIPDGLCILHKCDNRACVNPNHLYLGTKKDNAKDCRERERHSCGNRHGMSKLNNEDVYGILDSEQTSKKLARIYNVSKDTINKVRSGKIWKHV